MRVIEAINPSEMFGYALYGHTSDEYRYNLERSLVGAISNLVDYTGHMKSNIMQTFNNFMSDDAAERAREAMYIAANPLGEDVVYLIDENNYQRINPYMQTVMMAHPDIRRMYEKQEIFGYEDTVPYLEELVDYKDSSIYQAVYSGIADEDHDTVFFQDSTDFLVSRFDQFTIIDSWRNALNMIADDDSDDPTDI